MSGHSKWATIKHKKGAADKARGKLFAKLIRQVEVAARQGGGDPETNPTLRTMFQKARVASVPLDTIERAIKRGTGELEGVNYEAITYEGYAPGGVALLVETLTDNRNRTNGEIRSVFEKGGGNMGTPGCVGYLFERKGLFLIDAKKFPDEDAVMTAALEAEAEDFKREGDFYEVTCDVAKFAAVQASLQAAGIVPEEAEVKNLPKTFVDVDVETGKKVVRLIDALDANDDVQTVYTNANLTEEMADA
jgi:YebC/PmpR family DNA-binding regulatory protein